MSKVKLGDVVQRIKDFVDKDNTDLLYYVGGEHFDNRSLTVNKKGIIAGSTIGPAFSTMFKSGDVLLMSRNPHLRKAGMVNFDGICSDVSYIIRTKDEKIIMQNFIPLLFQSDAFWHFAEKNKKGSTNFFLNWSDFEKFEFELPSHEEQKNICDLLWSINETKNSYLKLIRMNDDLLWARFIETFGDIFRGESKYPLKPISDFVEQKIGRSNKSFKSDDQILYLDISSIDNKINKITGYTNYKMSEAPSRAQQCVRSGDIVISTVRPNLKNVSIVVDNYSNIVASSGFCVLRPKNINLNYLYSIVSSQAFANYLTNLTNGANYPAVSNSDILSFKIPHADRLVEEKFADFVSNLRKINNELLGSVNTISNLFDIYVNKFILED